MFATLRFPSAFDEVTLEGVVALLFALDLFAGVAKAGVAEAGVAAALNCVARVLLTGVLMNEARDGFFRLPGLAGFAPDFRTGV